jgi:hypothetical protein
MQYDMKHLEIRMDFRVIRNACACSQDFGNENFLTYKSKLTIKILYSCN